ncbi:hypothetical protein K461DRAFT_279451 [Myriangium duriaei CBS 260.36]|uniref:Uncharacterized protein n=1 Tax=Myriangium duriaei CBS 260.36 TaxID=1168546 RepID=A0A9P4MF42_9PEZI|nr:hypothetical protein K461DRAFT_279451 [Myriangium duriaei CBS 260.36]
MCCGDSARTAMGGTIATLKSKSGVEPDINLFFNSHKMSTIASIQGHTSLMHHGRSSLDVQIHEDGDLRATNHSGRSLHTFTLPCTDVGNFKLPFAMNLSVGGDGIIGRRISMVHQGPEGQTIVRHGIIGWN